MSETANSLADLETLGADVQAPVQIAAVVREQEIDAQGRAYATGRRKDAVARVWLKPGTGKIVVNGRDQEVYFARPSLRLVINQPFGVTERTGQYDVIATVKGGGLSGQAGTVKHGISKLFSADRLVLLYASSTFSGSSMMIAPPKPSRCLPAPKPVIVPPVPTL